MAPRGADGGRERRRAGAPAGSPQHLLKRSFRLAGHRTSVALEAEFWAALETIAAARGYGLVALIREVDAARDPAVGLASALRLLALREARNACNAHE